LPSVSTIPEANCLKSQNPWHCPFKLPFACTKLYTLLFLPTGKYIHDRIYVLKGPPPPPTHTSDVIIFLRAEGRVFTYNTAEMFSCGPNPTRAKNAWPSSTCLLYGGRHARAKKFVFLYPYEAHIDKQQKNNSQMAAVHISVKIFTKN
jgi:hypothetical protein